MALIREQVEAAVIALSSLPPEAARGAAIALLRERVPGIAIMACDASDVLEAPALTVGRFDVHLLDGRDHCVAVTNDPTHATGLLLAQRETVA